MKSLRDDSNLARVMGRHILQCAACMMNFPSLATHEVCISEGPDLSSFVPSFTEKIDYGIN